MDIVKKDLNKGIIIRSIFHKTKNSINMIIITTIRFMFHFGIIKEESISKLIVELIVNI
jgi:hypothetical protein